jgi:hypothetical protein
MDGVTIRVLYVRLDMMVKLKRIDSYMGDTLAGKHFESLQNGNCMDLYWK